MREVVPPTCQKDIKVDFLNGEKVRFLKHMEGLSAIANDEVLPLKVLKYLNLYRAGLPLDSTVRYYDGINTQEITQRIQELCGVGFEVWTSFATPEIPNNEVSIQRKTPLIKRITSVADYEKRVGSTLAFLPKGTWVKLFYDIHEDDLADTELAKVISGTIRVTSGSQIPEEREIIIGWGKTSDVRLIDREIQWSSADPVWRYMNQSEPGNPTTKLRVDNPEVMTMIRKIMGRSEGEYRKKMALLAQKEGRRSICFEFKIRPGTQLPFFFIDYEYAGEPRRSSFSWFFYGKEGD